MLISTSVYAADVDDFVADQSTDLNVENFIDFDGLSSAPGLSSSNEGRLYYDTADNKFKFSENGSPFDDLVGGPNDFRTGGEASGANRNLGNTDAFNLDIITNGTSRITVLSSGNVGIGSTSPNQPLEVNGAIKSVEALNVTAATINVDWSAGNQQTVILNQAGHGVDFSNFFPGQIFRLVVCQDGTGGRTITNWVDDVRFPSGATSIALSSTANTCDVISFIVTDAAGLPGGTVILGTIVRGFDAS